MLSSIVKGKTEMKSWKAEVIADSSGEFCSNALRFATKAEAEGYVADLEWRWTAVREKRVVECDDPVNYKFSDGKAERI
jgi:hypothetical protein